MWQVETWTAAASGHGGGRSAELHLGAVVYSPSGSELDGLDEIAFLPNANPVIRGWHGGEADGDTMEDGWMRYNSAEIFGSTIFSWIFLDRDGWMAWLSQANHIFHRLQNKSSYEDYAIIDSIHFWLRILEPTQTPPKGYLFICPSKDLKTGPSSLQWPDCPAYWSLDPLGAERLSTDEAMHLGFPSIELETRVYRRYWDASVYAGLRKFHEGKGFDPESQDVAQHLGLPLYKLSHEVEGPFAHVDEVSNAETETEGGSTTTTEDEDEDEDGSSPEDEDGEVSDVKTKRESSHTTTTKDEDGDGLAPEDVDGEISEAEANSEGSSPATNEDEDRDELTPQEKQIPECASLHSDVELSWSWNAIMFVKLGLILALGFGSLCEYGRAVLSQQDI
ncbi:hypothetical protein B0H11DRAFT_1903746 [Mycena galericulata]|nr:hypothetical protein B0H11DRAFT_1903746 [Mycena galericulata]